MSPCRMFVRVKKIAGRRYLYLVEGKRAGSKVRQRVVCYLGPISKIAFGIPEGIPISGSGGRRLDMKSINQAIQRIPIKFEELSEARLARLPSIARERKEGFLSSGTRDRIPGEGEVLAQLAAVRFSRLFAKVDRMKYRMR